jgi:hypothetical protein
MSIIPGTYEVHNSRPAQAKVSSKLYQKKKKKTKTKTNQTRKNENMAQVVEPLPSK